MPTDAATDHADSEQQLEKIRTLLLGKENSKVTASIKKDARSLVADVITEALHDRQKKDNSVNKVLQPFVEESVKQSVAHNSEQLVSALYPLVGSLVRKSVAAFLSDFMEKTNQLLENSLTIKGLKWRFKARQSGISYAQYAASQTFVYRVEHVFLIHRESGLLLSTVAREHESNSNADIVSAMLTAINDFVGDSFLTDQEGQKEQLQAVSTDNFNLLIKPGPSALVVAAVSGNPPQSISNQLQLTLENIHSLYFDELNSFNGDNKDFDSVDNLLRDCLLSEQKTVTAEKKKIPWLAWSIVSLVMIYVGYQSFNWFKSAQLHEKIMQLDNQPGIIIKRLKINQLDNISLDILRDPDALNINDWLKENALIPAQLTITERNYRSLDQQILQQRAQRIISAYPSINASWQNHHLMITGTVDLIKIEQLRNTLAIAGFTEGENLNTEQLTLVANSPSIASEEIKQQLFEQLIGRIASIQLNFSVASESITPQMQTSLQRLYLYMQQLTPIAKDLNIDFGLLILGSSDNTGSKNTNNILSIKRANNTAEILQSKGIAKDKMYVVGLGQINIKNISRTARSVMFKVIYINHD
ncbi:flagellar motor protein MotB [Colwellia sp. M166]|uniref:OmpA family protein n=1 Tax=Colwellia sp. M166 TaxID=2583805 RepID=UPI00211F2E99|nr:OmpA family protein [Colwellia sp. M166]UUO23332.1 flagellar motor protein MotB [Colwellia sp. M166]|tara:strand:+ start:23661 stop:25421 length:1761 start_codon:yes stop_codon:yes gene_type:complete